ncbi:hypothetical protein KHA94_04725 [Bacillus sp. FJAT-49705]|uniref:Uncharacterized protein n=1 Tax=Cytobacillus citreus TaxID=2833586 RepID=A0ABS5NNV7_9BACI|nr:hypothetical protein [Cytobacillus citreus]MBS4189517.1 hypothetical protein [Cytobacillus citreus]
MTTTTNASAAVSDSIEYKNLMYSKAFLHDSSLGPTKLVTNCRNTSGWLQNVYLERSVAGGWKVEKSSSINCGWWSYQHDEIKWLTDNTGNYLPKGTYRFVFQNQSGTNSTTYMNYTIY